MINWGWISLLIWYIFGISSHRHPQTMFIMLLSPTYICTKTCLILIGFLRMGWDTKSTALTYRCVLGRLVYRWLCGYCARLPVFNTHSHLDSISKLILFSTRNCMWLCLLQDKPTLINLCIRNITLSRLKITLFIGLSLGISSDCIGNSFTRLPAVFSSLFYMQQIVLEKIEGLMDAVLRNHPKMFKCTHNCVALIMHLHFHLCT